MMIEEIKITVTVGVEKFSKIYLVNTDGSYDSVCKVVEKIVSIEWGKGRVEKISWNYC